MNQRLLGCAVQLNYGRTVLTFYGRSYDIPCLRMLLSFFTFIKKYT